MKASFNLQDLCTAHGLRKISQTLPYQVVLCCEVSVCGSSVQSKEPTKL